jgi:hypothetical protein
VRLADIASANADYARARSINQRITTSSCDAKASSNWQLKLTTVGALS